MNCGKTDQHVHIIGAGLAGCEAAWILVKSGISVVIHEMRPWTMTEVHRTSGFAELVCSNSLRSDDPQFNAVGVLHEELRLAGSLIMAAADSAKVPAGGALAVDRDRFSQIVTETLKNHPRVTVEHGEISNLEIGQCCPTIIATGPLTSPALGQALAKITGNENLAFFDAIAPIVYHDSIDLTVCWYQSRHDKTLDHEAASGDYINCPFTKHQYQDFIAALLAADKASFRPWETDSPYFEGCLPIEVMAERGIDTLRYGPMKPIGLNDPHSGHRPYAVVQLRQDNAAASLWNMVGFQTKLKHPEQQRVFRTIPGLKNVRFARLGGIHRNMFVNSPQVLSTDLRLRNAGHVRLAGQLTGCEGYVESAAIGLMAGKFTINTLSRQPPNTPPRTSGLGSLLNYVTSSQNTTDKRKPEFQPMNINFGLFPDITPAEITKFTPMFSAIRHAKRRRKKAALAQRALTDIAAWLST